MHRTIACRSYVDDFNVTHIKSPVIETSDYYASGNTFNSYVRENSTLNKFKFQATEFQEDLGLKLYGFDSRFYDPFTWRTVTQDPHAEDYESMSPYSFLGNNPMNMLDPTGMDAISLNGGSENGLAICATCPKDDPKFKPFIDDPRNNFHYDPATRNVSLLLDEVTVSTDKQKETSEANNIALPMFAPEAPFIFRIGAGAATAVALTVAFVLPTSTNDGEMEMLDKTRAMYIPAPKVLPGFPGDVRVKRKAGRSRWKDVTGDILEWDSQHGE